MNTFNIERDFVRWLLSHTELSAEQRAECEREVMGEVNMKYSVTVTRSATVYEELTIEIEAFDPDTACTLAEEQATRCEDGLWFYLDHDEFKYESKVNDSQTQTAS